MAVIKQCLCSVVSHSVLRISMRDILMLLYLFISETQHKVLFYITGVLGSRMWTASLSVGLTILVSKGIKLAERAWLPLMFISWGWEFIIVSWLVSRLLVDCYCVQGTLYHHSAAGEHMCCRAVSSPSGTSWCLVFIRWSAGECIRMLQ